MKIKETKREKFEQKRKVKKYGNLIQTFQIKKHLFLLKWHENRLTLIYNLGSTKEVSPTKQKDFVGVKFLVVAPIEKINLTLLSRIVKK